MQRDSVKELLGSSLHAIRDMAVVKKDKNAALCFYASRERVIGIASKHSLKKILSVYDAVCQAIEDFNYNANVPNTLIALTMSAKRKGN